MKVLLVAAEVAPFAKVGGLADVAGSLPKALAARGVDVRVIMPKYREVMRKGFEMWRVVPECRVPMAGWDSGCALDEGRLPGSEVPIYFVEHFDYFDRDGVYGSWPDDLERLTFFNRAALAVLEPLNWRPDVIHINDYHTSLIAVYNRGETPPSVLTLHNIGYQGEYPREQVGVTGIDPDDPTNAAFISERGINLMRAGLACADLINAVSPTHAREIIEGEFAPGVADLIAQRKDDVSGILNGIDYSVWNPASDPGLDATFSRDDLAGKAVCKAALQREAGLREDPDVPVIGMITRLAAQKGFDILSEALDRLCGVQLVVLGTGEPQYERMFQEVAAQRDDVAVFLRFDASLAKRIYAGSDMFLMPSLYEPCGLGQMIAMAYGTVPVVRATGGLADSVMEKGNKSNGYTFTEYTADALLAAVERAKTAYAKRDQWTKRMLRAMAWDFSWDASAAKYEALYAKAIAKYTRG
jgi:starch synthase